MLNFKRPVFFLLGIIVLIMAMLSMSFCSPWMMPGDGGYGGDDPDIEENDNYEPDNSYTEANTIPTDGTHQEHVIFNENDEYDIDYIKFTGYTATTYRINMFDIVGFEPELTLYAGDGTTVIEMKNTGTYTGDYDWWGYDSDHNFSPDEKESIVFEASNDGTYYVSVKDVYGAHGRGRYSIKVKAVIEIGTTDTLVATPDTQNFAINVSWGGISGVDGYFLYRTSEPQGATPNYSDFNIVETLSGTSYVDTEIDPNVTYYYYVTGYVGSEEGEPSNVDDAMFDWAEFKPTSSLISASEGIPNEIQISLEQKYNNSNIQRYEVYRADSVGADPATYVSKGEFLQSDSIGTILTDTDVDVTDPPTYYYYCVRIVIIIDTTEHFSQYSFFDSGAAGQ